MYLVLEDISMVRLFFEKPPVAGVPWDPIQTQVRNLNYPVTE